MVAISRSKVNIWIADAGVNAANAASSTDDAIKGEIKSYSKSGGERDTESDPHFGGYVDKEKPISQVELSFEVTPKVDANQDRWDGYAYSQHATGVYVMSGDVTDKSVYIEATDGTGYKSWGFNNCNVTVLDLEHNADDNQSLNMTLKFSPTNESGISNFQTAATEVENLKDWSTLTV